MLYAMIFCHFDNDLCKKLTYTKRVLLIFAFIISTYYVINLHNVLKHLLLSFGSPSKCDTISSKGLFLISECLIVVLILEPF